VQGTQTEAQKALAALPVRVHLPPESSQAEAITLETACQHSDRDHQQQPIDPLGIPQAAVLQLKHT
jgi:hypothetical protein